MVVSEEYISFFQKLFNDNRDLVVKLYHERTGSGIDNGEPRAFTQIIKDVSNEVIFSKIPLKNNYDIVVYYYYSQTRRLPLNQGRVRAVFHIPVDNEYLKKLIREKKLSQLIGI